MFHKINTYKNKEGTKQYLKKDTNFIFKDMKYKLAQPILTDNHEWTNKQTNIQTCKLIDELYNESTNQTSRIIRWQTKLQTKPTDETTIHTCEMIKRAKPTNKLTSKLHILVFQLDKPGQLCCSLLNSTPYADQKWIKVWRDEWMNRWRDKGIKG